MVNFMVASETFEESAYFLIRFICMKNYESSNYQFFKNSIERLNIY